MHSSVVGLRPEVELNPEKTGGAFGQVLSRLGWALLAVWCGQLTPR